MFRLKLFGSASIEGPDGPVTGRAVQRRRLGLLALLAVARERGLTRDRLIGYLWPDADTERARPMLSDSVYRINQAVGGDAITGAGDDLRLNPDRLSADAWEFAEAIARKDWSRAVELHVDPFLDGFFLTDSDELERWVDAQRERFARDKALALEELATAAERDGDLPGAVRWWRTLAAHDPYSSRIALHLMQALDASGDPAGALQHERVHTQLLDDELGLAPDAELLAFADDLRARPAPRPAARRAEPVLPSAVPPGESADRLLAPPRHDDVTPTAASLERARPAWRRPAIAAALAGLAIVTVAAIAVLAARGNRSAAAQSIAVLPFADLSPNGEYAWFADGMTEELIARLALVDGLAVVGRTSVFALKNATLDVRDIGARLGVANVLEGSVRHEGDRLRIVAKLIDVSNGYQLWTETFERSAADVFAVQDEIARQIVARLRGTADGASATRSGGGTTDDLEAFNLYLRGRYEWHRRTEQSLRTAADYFRQAVARDPDYARAHAGLADANAVLGFYDYLPPREAFPAATVAARRALELAPDYGEPHATIAYVALYYDWDWPRAEAEFRRAIQLEPAYSTAHQWYANYLTAMGRFDEAASAMGRAMELDPLSRIANAALGWVYFLGSDSDRADRQLTRIIELDSTFALAWLWRGQARTEAGETQRGITDLQTAVRLGGGSALDILALARARGLAGQRDAALTLLRDLASTSSSYVPPYELATVHAALGDTAAALSALEQAFADRSHSMAFLAVDPRLANLHDRPRFRALIGSVGLTDTPGWRNRAR